MPLAINNGSYWNATARTAPEFPQLSGEVNVDVAIVGGGIVGVTAARLMKDRGLSVALVEALRVGRQVTGKSTAKVTVQHNIIYTTLAEKFGEERAHLYAEAQDAGLKLIESLAAQHNIAADLERAPAFTWTGEEEFADRLREEAALARKLRLNYSITTETGLPFPVLAAMRTDDQAQFQPVDFVAGLAATIPGRGCHVFEHSRVTDWDTDRVQTDAGTVRARHVLMATNLPLGQTGAYFARTKPKAEPMAAAPVAQDVGGMYICAEQPKWSVRTHRNGDGKLYAVAVGEEFKPGHTEDQNTHFDALAGWLNRHFRPESITHRWVNEDYTAMDQAPFVGWSTAGPGGYLVATGFDAWGLTNGAASAIMLTELATGNDHPWLALFRADRVKPVEGGKEFAEAQASAAEHLAKRFLSSRHESFDRLAPGQAEVLDIEGENVAAYKDENGVVHAVSAVCTHMGCLVGWNGVDHSWDCPCHGSRFAVNGEVLHGPAVGPLKSRIGE
ncbi:MAG: FAD-dependent oxidoreductase [Alphaproteobacteria bacterium]